MGDSHPYEAFPSRTPGRQNVAPPIMRAPVSPEVAQVAKERLDKFKVDIRKALLFIAQGLGRKEGVKIFNEDRAKYLADMEDTFSDADRYTLFRLLREPKVPSDKELIENAEYFDFEEGSSVLSVLSFLDAFAQGKRYEELPLTPVRSKEALKTVEDFREDQLVACEGCQKFYIGNSNTLGSNCPLGHGLDWLKSYGLEKVIVKGKPPEYHRILYPNPNFTPGKPMMVGKKMKGDKPFDLVVWKRQYSTNKEGEEWVETKAKITPVAV